MLQFNQDETAKIEATLGQIAIETSYEGPWHLIAQHGTESPEVLETSQDVRTVVERAVEVARDLPYNSIVFVRAVQGAYVPIVLIGER